MMEPHCVSGLTDCEGRGEPSSVALGMDRWSVNGIVSVKHITFTRGDDT